MPAEAVFPTVYIGDNISSDSDTLESELVQLARSAVRDYPDVGALVLECTNFVPYAAAIRRAVGLPVFDLYTAVMQAYLATTGHDFSKHHGIS